MGLQMGFRQPGAKLRLPAVVHWRSGHFAAILQREESTGRPLYRVQDPTFGDEIWISEAALEDEASGYFLIPA